jgi:hypothetical protein
MKNIVDQKSKFVYRTNDRHDLPLVLESLLWAVTAASGIWLEIEEM